MNFGKRIYLVIGLVALIALAGSAVTVTSGLVSAGGDPTPTAQTCDAQDEADDANEAENGQDDANEPEDGQDDAADAKGAPDTDNVEEQCGDQSEADDANEAKDDPSGDPANAGKLDDGKDLLSQAGITLDQAIAAAQGAASGGIGEIDLEDYNGKLAFNVDVGDKDVKVDAADGSVLSSDSGD